MERILQYLKNPENEKLLRSLPEDLFKGKGVKGENLAFIGPPKMTVQDVDCTTLGRTININIIVHMNCAF